MYLSAITSAKHRTTELLKSPQFAKSPSKRHSSLGEMPPPPPPPKQLSWPQLAVNCSVRFLLWSLFGYILFLSVVDVQAGKALFSWHPPLLTLSVILMSESMLCFSATNLATHQLSYRMQVRCHWMLQALSAACAACGFLLVVVHKFRADKSHFSTYHAKYGLAALLCTAVTSAAGAVAKYSVQLRHLVRPLNTKIVHAALALSNYKLSVLAMLLGLWSSWFGKHGTEQGFWGCLLVGLAVSVYVGVKPTRTLVARVRSAWMRAYDL